MKTAWWAAAFALGASTARAEDDLLKRDIEDLWLPRQPEPTDSAFMLGPATGYVRSLDADEGTWYGGVFARVRLGRPFAIEASATLHYDRYQDGDIRVAQYPVQLSALWFPFRHDLLRPYAIAGAGVQYTKVRYEDGLEGQEDEDDSVFAWHVGAGAEIQLGRPMSLTADFRWVFVDPPDVENSTLDEEDFDTWQVAIGLGFHF